MCPLNPTFSDAGKASTETLEGDIRRNKVRG
nr:MAG TPA: hypothetical protein [Caudoviricetes sp.]